MEELIQHYEELIAYLERERDACVAAFDYTSAQYFVDRLFGAKRQLRILYDLKNKNITEIDQLKLKIEYYAKRLVRLETEEDRPRIITRKKEIFKRNIRQLKEELAKKKAASPPPKLHVDTDFLEQELALLIEEKNNSFAIFLKHYKKEVEVVRFSIDTERYEGIRITVWGEPNKHRFRQLQSMGFLFDDETPYLAISKAAINNESYLIKGIIANLILNVYGIRNLDKEATIVWERNPL